MPYLEEPPFLEQIFFRDGRYIQLNDSNGSNALTPHGMAVLTIAHSPKM